MEEENNLLEFGIKRDNEERRDGGCAVVFDPDTGLCAVGKHDADGFFRLFSGGVDDGEDMQEGILREVVEESGLHDFLYVEKIGEAIAHYHNSLRKVNRIGKVTCLLIILKSRDSVGAKLEEHEKFSLVWVKTEEIFSNWMTRSKENRPGHWIYFLEKAVKRLKELGYITT